MLRGGRRVIIQGRTFTPAPEGMHDAVCVDVVDLGNIETHWGIKPKIRLVFELSALMQDGRRYIQGRRYTASLDSRSMLHKHLKSWRGKSFTAEELKAFDTEVLVGVPCQIVITLGDNEKGDRFSVIETIMRADAKRFLTPSGDYVRVKDRTEEEPQQTTPDWAAPTTSSDPSMSAVLSGRTNEGDNIPF